VHDIAHFTAMILQHGWCLSYSNNPGGMLSFALW